MAAPIPEIMDGYMVCFFVSPCHRVGDYNIAVLYAGGEEDSVLFS
jgi:hypothetical protein